MVKASRPTVKTLTIVKNRDIVVDRLLKPCEEDNHAKCTGWAVLRKEVSPIDANYFLRCICTCHHKKEQKRIKKQPQQIRKKRIKKKAKRKLKPVKKSKKSMMKRRR
ncbi:MAG TPA: hypothetical protein VGJ42_02115 [Nitrososphaera sp.]|jgi:hypothetical protein